MGIKDITDTFLGNKKPEKSSEIVKPSITLFEWEAPDRFFKKHPREFYRRIAVIMCFFGLIFLFLKEFIVLAVFGAVFFVVYVFHTVPPRKVVHKVTTNGVLYASEHMYIWDELRSFFIEKKDGLYVLVLNTVDTLPGRLYMILDPSIDRAKLSESVNEKLSIQEVPESNIYEDLMKKITSKMKLG